MLKHLILSCMLAPSAWAEPIVIDDATIHTMGPQGTLVNGRIVIDDGVIQSVSGDPAPDDASIGSTSGRVVTPGLFAAASFLGLVEVNAVPDTVDYAQTGSDFTASLNVASMYNPRSTLVAVSRSEGITNALITAARGATTPIPNTNPFTGTAAVVHLGQPQEAIAISQAAIGVQLAKGALPISRSTTIQSIRTAFADAAHYARHKARYDRGASRSYLLSAADLAALGPVIDGDLPLIVNADRAIDIKAIVELADELNLSVVINGATEAWMVAEDLARIDAGVILNPTQNLPTSFDRINARLDSAALLAAAGVRVAFGGTRSHNLGNLTQLAGIAVANGMRYSDALAAITRNPAEMYEIADTLGSIETGKTANVVIWPGDPLELANFPVDVVIQGERIPMTTRQTLLRDRYLEPSATPPAFR